jgi:phosphatidylinositol alpha-1,6-mannosyltransferase
VTGRTLVITNDFPPRPGGIQSFVHGLTTRMPEGSVVVLTSSWRGAEAFDAKQPFAVERIGSTVMVPEPRVLRRAREIAKTEGCDRVLYGAAAPLGLLSAALRRSGVERFVALTHGHEAAWAQLPGSRSMLRRIGEQTDTITYLGEYTRRRIAAALTPAAAARMVRLTPGVDDRLFHPGVDGAPVRAKHGLADRPVVACVSRLMPRKGQDTLLRVWPAVLRAHPDAMLLLVGGGPYRDTLEKQVDALGLRGSVVITGSVAHDELPAHYAAADVFAMPCRTRRRGLDVEGLGIVYLEAAATGKPVVTGDSGGAPDAVLHGSTGWTVPGDEPVALTARLVELLDDPAAARAMGERGRTWVEKEWTWARQSATLDALLAGDLLPGD